MFDRLPPALSRPPPIVDLRQFGFGVRAIASELNRSPSTISRDLHNADEEARRLLGTTASKSQANTRSSPPSP